LMISCHIDMFYPRVRAATLELLEHLTVEVIYPALRSADGEQRLR